MKDNNEITLKIIGKIEDFKKNLIEKGYETSGNFILYDVYMIPKNLDIQRMTIRDIISKSIIIRKVDDFYNNEIRNDVVYKTKEYDENGDIISQNSIRMRIMDPNDGIKLFESIGYKKLMIITEEDFVYSNGDISIATKNIKDGDNLIEVEARFNTKYSTLDELKKYLKNEKLSLDFSNCFVKKAEIELSKIMNRS